MISKVIFNTGAFVKREGNKLTNLPINFTEIFALHIHYNKVTNGYKLNQCSNVYCRAAPLINP
jgi:hypothetical protein